jgi:hypothetical protein
MYQKKLLFCYKIFFPSRLYIVRKSVLRINEEVINMYILEYLGTFVFDKNCVAPKYLLKNLNFYAVLLINKLVSLICLILLANDILLVTYN